VFNELRRPIPLPNGRLLIGRALAVTLAALVALSGLLVMQTPPLTSPPTMVPSFGTLPLSFLPNVGLTDPEVRFAARWMGGTLLFTPHRVVLASPETNARLAFEGANPSAEIKGVDVLPGTVNYYLGSDPSQWHTSLPTYAGVVYQQLYPGIDLHYNGTAGALKGTYIVAPGAEPARIRWNYEGATEVRVDEATGNLLVSPGAMGPHPNALPEGEGRQGVVADGPVRQGGGGASPRVQIPEGEGITPLSASLIEGTPTAWQSINGRPTPVEVRYALLGDPATPTVGFALGPYDPAFPLIIDPSLSYSTYLGGSKADVAYAIAIDSAGSTYVTGETFSTDFAGASGTNGGSGDAFVTKLNQTGSAVVYTTYIGGNAGEQGNAIAVDSSGNAYITGSTKSSNFPTLNPVQGSLSAASATNAFITKLNTTGALSYSTYLGAVSYVLGLGIAVDGASSAYITGDNSGDVLIVKMDAAGALVYGTAFGGSSSDWGNAIAVDVGGNAYITGRTQSRDFPTSLDALQRFCDKATSTSANNYCSQDAFVAKVNLSPTGGELLYSSFLGGTASDEGKAIALDSAGNIYVAGDTSSGDFPTVNPAQTSPCTPNTGCTTAFVSKLSASGTALQYSSYLGGDNGDWAKGIAVDSDGSAYVLGTTQSRNLPVIDPVQPGSGGGTCSSFGSFRLCYDAFVVKLTPSGNALVYSTYLGGSSDERGGGIAVDGAGNAYVTGESESINFPTTQGAVRPSFGGDLREAFVTKIAPGDASGATPTPTGTFTPTVSPTTTPVPGLSPRAYLPLGVRSYGGAW